MTSWWRRRIDTYHHYPDHQVVSEIKTLRDLISKNQETLMATLEQVLNDVTQEPERLGRISELVSGLRQQIADALADVTLPPDVQEELDAIFTQLETNKAKIDAALNADVPPPA